MLRLFFSLTRDREEEEREDERKLMLRALSGGQKTGRGGGARARDQNTSERASERALCASCFESTRKDLFPLLSCHCLILPHI